MKITSHLSLKTLSLVGATATMIIKGHCSRKRRCSLTTLVRCFLELLHFLLLFRDITPPAKGICPLRGGVVGVVHVQAFSVASSSKQLRSSSSTAAAKIITGPLGKPASSREEDLRLTIQIIQDFHKKLLVVEEEEEEDGDDVVVSGVQVQAVFSEDESTTILDEAATATTSTIVVQEEKAAVRSISSEKVEKPAAAAMELIRSAITPIEEDTLVDGGEDKVLQEIMETLSRPVYSGPLKRLAMAFGPGLQLNSNRIASTSVICLSRTRIEIGALVCDEKDDVCVNVAVPIPFFKPCIAHDGNNGDLLENSILDAIEELDVLATQRIEASERALDNAEQISWEQSLFLELRDDSITPVFPDWWTEPMGNQWELQDECATLKRLLNEDEFRVERHALVTQQLQQQQQQQQGTVTQAAVALVGSSGLLLRANLECKEDDAYDSTATTKNRIVDLPMLFLDGTAEARTVVALRTAVLDLVDSVAAADR
jgi:hypothetical protein